MIWASPARYHSREILGGDCNTYAEKAESAEVGIVKGWPEKG
jgi:hypothetical protein